MVTTVIENKILKNKYTADQLASIKEQFYQAAEILVNDFIKTKPKDVACYFEEISGINDTECYKIYLILKSKTYIGIGYTTKVLNGFNLQEKIKKLKAFKLNNMEN